MLRQQGDLRQTDGSRERGGRWVTYWKSGIRGLDEPTVWLAAWSFNWFVQEITYRRLVNLYDLGHLRRLRRLRRRNLYWPF